MIAMDLITTTWSGSEMYCLSREVTNTLCTCLSYISRSGRQVVEFDLSHELIWCKRSWPQFRSQCNLRTPLFGEVFWKTLSYTINSRKKLKSPLSDLSFSYQHSFFIGSNGMLPRVLWDKSPYWMLKKIFMTQKMILLSMSVIIFSWCLMKDSLLVL